VGFPEFQLWLVGFVFGRAGLDHEGLSVRESRKAEMLKRATTMLRLDTEIAFRLAMALEGLSIAEIAVDGRFSSPQYIYRAVYNSLENYFIHDPQNARDFSVFPEYRERTFRALLLELRTAIDTADIPDLKDALDAYEEVSDNADTGSLDESLQACSEAVTKMRNLLQNRMVRRRWRSMVDFLIIRGNSGTHQDSPQSKL
jgi:hypothetical protein